MSFLFQFTVTLRDNGQPSSRQAAQSADVVINVNRNEFSPLFFNSTYYATILESLPVGSSVALVSAQDRDTSVRQVVFLSVHLFNSLLDLLFCIFCHPWVFLN